MKRKPVRGLFITGTDTGVGKTYVGALIAKALVADGRRVGVYKPAASGCRVEEGALISDDAVHLWQAAGLPGELARVCPQMFRAPLAPHLAAELEGKRLDADLLRSGLDYWLDRSEFVLVEGSGGLLSPLGDQYVADLAYDFGFPLIVVARNALGVINQTLQTLIAAAFRDGINVAGVVLNEANRDGDDVSIASNRSELERCTTAPILAEVTWQAENTNPPLDWWKIAGQ